MAENVTIARPYAEAAFKLALETGTLAQWADALMRMAAAAAEPEVRGVLSNPLRSASDRASIFLSTVPGDLSEDQRGFAQVLGQNGRLSLLPEVHDMFVTLKNAQESVKAAHITSAFALDDGALAKLVADLEQRFGCKLQTEVSVDAELIGGVKIAVGDQVIDASVRGKLAAMATALQN